MHATHDYTSCTPPAAAIHSSVSITALTHTQWWVALSMDTRRYTNWLQTNLTKQSPILDEQTSYTFALVNHLPPNDTCRVSHQCSAGRYIRTLELGNGGSYAHNLYARTRLWHCIPGMSILDFTTAIAQRLCHKTSMIGQNYLLSDGAHSFLRKSYQWGQQLGLSLPSTHGKFQLALLFLHWTTMHYLAITRCKRYHSNIYIVW